MRDVPIHIEIDFSSGKRNKRIPWVVNDVVRVMTGPREVECGSVISIEAIEPFVNLIIEFGSDGRDSILRAIDVERIE